MLRAPLKVIQFGKYPFPTSILIGILHTSRHTINMIAARPGAALLLLLPLAAGLRAETGLVHNARPSPLAAAGRWAAVPPPAGGGGGGPSFPSVALAASLPGGSGGDDGPPEDLTGRRGRGIGRGSGSGSGSGGRDGGRLTRTLRRAGAKISPALNLFRTLSRRLGRSDVTGLLLNCLLLAFVVRDALPGLAATCLPVPPPAPVSRVEVPYSAFLDQCEGAAAAAGRGGRGAAVGSTAAAAVLDGPVRVDPAEGGSVRYRLLRPETRGQRAEVRRRARSSGRGDFGGSGFGSGSGPVPIPAVEAEARVVGDPADLVRFLRSRGIPFEAAEPAEAAATSWPGGGVGGADGGTVPALAVGYLGYRLYQNGGLTGRGGGGGGMGRGTGRGSGRSSSPPSADASSSGGALEAFSGIEGIDSAKRDVLELVDSLRSPAKFDLVGARPPTGLLLVGPPGTGKTTLARATASAAGVPFLHASGSDFVEKYVGTGAARVRKLFARAERARGPCIVFIDEIDALGKKRRDGAGSSGSSDEAEQTLNALLTAMDGMDTGSGICVMGATNRRDVLDPALIRPGRFDRIVTVDLPDRGGRERILRVHASKLRGFTEGRGVDGRSASSLGRGVEVDLEAVAGATPGLSGAELELVVNEAAIRAVRRVGAQIEAGVDPGDADGRVYPGDFEASVEAFFESRERRQSPKGRMGFTIA